MIRGSGKPVGESGTTHSTTVPLGQFEDRLNVSALTASLVIVLPDV